ncbi:putative polyketide synthase 2 [Grifola frondosa]|uniref:Putative polyketide synthase 2 n=1 Tax=Grifola frondosa TaxID=5627 RepID=A0A1C7LLI5_GRIFR|nr:putative polyketide synthase 2 [Grifola frondosa]
MDGPPDARTVDAACGCTQGGDSRVGNVVNTPTRFVLLRPSCQNGCRRRKWCYMDTVGIAAELPSGTWSKMNLNYKSFFEFLLQKGESYEQIPTERFNIHTLIQPSVRLRGDALGHIITDTGAFLKEIERFDYLEFGVTSKDARLMPLSTRKLIETTFVSLIDSGIDYRGKNIGCYMAGVAHDMFSVSGHDDAEARGSFACAPAMIANRVSYHLDLRGPSVPIDTACSSSLYATHLAVQALRAGECEAAVVGGCQLNHRFTEWLTYTQGGILSADGKCKPFDAQADGFGRSEGVVSIVLKPLDAALRDNDKIYATILGTGVNSSGSLAPVNAPVAAAQQDAMLRAFAQTGRLPRDVDYVELHATGTAQGDPTEANWVGARFKRDGELLIGSVKGNIGCVLPDRDNAMTLTTGHSHLEITAFLASICKVCSIFESGLIPPNVNFNCPNPAIKWHEYQLRVPTEVEPLRCRSASGRPLVAMTSSGIGGANGHCAIEGPPSAARIPTTFWRADITAVPSLLIASGLSPRSATAVGDDLKALVPGHNLRFLSRTYGRRARSMIWRSFAVAMDGALSKFSEPVLTPKNEPTMGRELFGACTAFRESILELDEIYRAAVGQSLIEFTGLFNTSSVADSLGATWPIAITLPALTMLQLALVDLLASLGVKPGVVMGHSAGETAMLSASGAGSKAMALELAIARGKAMSYAEDAKGTMAALSCSSDNAQKIIDEVAKELGEGLLEIGCFNTPTAVTLSGLETHIDLAVAKAQASDIFARKLRTRVPACRDVFARYDVGRPIVETYSTKTGTFLDVAFDAQYFWDNTRGPVLFTDAMQAAVAAHPNATFLEIGPHPVLTSYITSMAGKSATVACPLRRSKPAEGSVEVFEFMQCLGKLIAAGHNCVQFDILCGTEDDDADLSLPPFPFARKEVPYLASTAEVARQRQHRNGPLNYPQLQINVKMFPGLADHVINGEPIMPAAGFIEMALEFGARKLFNVEFISILPLSSDRPIPVDVKLEGPRWSVHSASSTDFTKTWPIKVNTNLM